MFFVFFMEVFTILHRNPYLTLPAAVSAGVSCCGASPEPRSRELVSDTPNAAISPFRVEGSGGSGSFY